MGKICWSCCCFEYLLRDLWTAPNISESGSDTRHVIMTSFPGMPRHVKLQVLPRTRPASESTSARRSASHLQVNGFLTTQLPGAIIDKERAQAKEVSIRHLIPIFEGRGPRCMGRLSFGKRDGLRTCQPNCAGNRFSNHRGDNKIGRAHV